MEAQYFIYTRGLLNDYNLMYYPSSDFCCDETRKFFRNQVKGAINTEKYESSLEEPRWLFSRYKGMVLWGIAILNKKISPEGSAANIDYTGRGVRGFFGIIIKDGTFDKLPYNLAYFKKLYSDLVVPFWSSDKDHFRHGGISVNEELDDPEVLYARPELSVLLNADFERTVILGDTYSSSEYISAAMGTDKDLSIITNLSTREHAYDHSLFFCNAIVCGIHTNEERKYQPKAREVKIQVSEFTNDIIEDSKPELPKKVLRPRVIHIILATAFIALAALLVKKCKNSPSGEKIEKNPKEQIEQVEQSNSTDSLNMSYRKK